MGNCLKTPVQDQDPSLLVPIPVQLQAFHSPDEPEHLLPRKKKPFVGDIRSSPISIDAPTARVSSPHKTPLQAEGIKSALISHFIFSSLPQENLECVIEQMQYYSLGPKETVVTQGEPGSNFFIIDSGKVEIIVNSTTKGYLSPGQSFGELALIHDSQRTATVRTLGPCGL